MKCLLITMWNVPYDVLLWADAAVSLPKLENMQTINNVLTEPHRKWEIYLPPQGIADVNCLWDQSVLFHQMRVWTNRGHLSCSRDKPERPVSYSFFFSFQRCSPLSGLSQYGFDQMRDASAAPINLCHLPLVPVCRPLASWHPYEADRLTAT